MLTLTSKRALAITISVVLAPFLLISIYSFFYIRINTENNFDETMFRFTSNSAHNCIENPIRKINVLFSSLSGMIEKHDIIEYISPNHSELNLLIPSLVNANEMLASVLISDNQDNYKIYPPFELENYKPSSRPWYHRDGFKDQVFYSEPYISAKKPTLNKRKKNR
ncbi:PDC sensor domain-containing protein [Buttiauxella massiliensis]|uniref:PDC sensor domain-containing protein n=1 Tax=Buttiauxella massiliensis TaxID=2831590 RepID=UPI00125F6DDF|nr:PDC sensor domain-containing protein [Buttiauxella massiliensis]